jgi:hypothetical protein
MERIQVSQDSKPARRKAIIISIREYYQLPTLEFCRNNGDMMYEILKELGYEIPDKYKLIDHVDYSTMREALYDFFTNPTIKVNDTLLFYYSGHGMTGTDGSVYLASTETNPGQPFVNGFSFDELTTTIDRSRSMRIVTIIDCVYGGAAHLSK